MTTSVLERNHINILGNGTQTIIFAHGFGSDQTAWRHQVAAFASDYRIVLFDHVGAGKSDFSAYSPHRYSSLYSYAEDLLEICHELKLTNSILVGHSVSGMISLLAALIDPSCFSQLIFVGASPRYLNDVGYVGGFDQSDLDALYGAMSANYYICRYQWRTRLAKSSRGKAFGINARRSGTEYDRPGDGKLTQQRR